jgi:hypothetical protein
MPVEDRIEHLSRLALVIILIATLGSISIPRSPAKKQLESARKTESLRLLPGTKSRALHANPGN